MSGGQWKLDLELGKTAFNGLDVDLPAMLVHYVIPADRQSGPLSLACRFVGKERGKHFLPNSGGNAPAVVTDAYFHLFWQFMGTYRQGGSKIAVNLLLFPVNLVTGITDNI